MVDRQTAETLVKVLGIVYIVFSAVMFLGAFFVLVMAGFVGAATQTVPAWADFRGEMDLAAGTMTLLMVLLALLAAGVAALILATGIGLLRNRSWSRVAGIVCGVLALFSFPVGTLVGVFAIWLLGFDKETARLLAGRAAGPPTAPFAPPPGA